MHLFRRFVFSRRLIKARENDAKTILVWSIRGKNKLTGDAIGKDNFVVDSSDDPDRTFQFKKRFPFVAKLHQNETINLSWLYKNSKFSTNGLGTGDKRRRNKALTSEQTGKWRKFVGNLALVEEKLLKRVLQENWKLLEKFRTRSSAGIAIF